MATHARTASLTRDLEEVGGFGHTHTRSIFNKQPTQIGICHSLSRQDIIGRGRRKTKEEEEEKGEEEEEVEEKEEEEEEEEEKLEEDVNS